MAAGTPTQKVVIVGAGPVGSLAALYAANRGYIVEIYELRGDLREPSTTPLNFTKSINLALSERGIHAMRCSGQSKLIDHVMASAIPMAGRMIHGRRPNGELYEQAQKYDVHGRCIQAIHRGRLIERMLEMLEAKPNVTFFYNHKLTGANFKTRKAWFEVQDGMRNALGRLREIEVAFDFMIGADGAHSAVRYHLMKFTRMDYQQEYIDTLWCEFRIPPAEGDAPNNSGARFRISPNYLHIWPGTEFMFIAIASEDGSFTCTLFADTATFEALEADPGQRLPAFFDRNFPGVNSLVSHEELIASFRDSPHLPLINIKCRPYHWSSSVVILGDAAHAMVPFYGQGMNAGLEDVRVLFSILDEKSALAASKPSDLGYGASDGSRVSPRALALTEYTAVRAPDAYAINDLALQNYVEMRASVLSPTYRLRKHLEETLSVYVPSLGWQTKYSRVSFSNERYSEVVAKTDHQGKVLVRSFIGAVGLPLLAGGFLYFQHRSAVVSAIRSVMRAVCRYLHQRLS